MTVFKGGRISGTVSPPPSKSRTHRAVFMASMADGESNITNALVSDDTMSTVEACRSLGAEVDVSGCDMKVQGGFLHAPVDTVDVGNSGTTLRIMTAVCSAFKGTTTITGDASLSKRPMQPLLDALSENGVECTSEDGHAPVTVKGPNWGGDFYVDGSQSSQFVTALMMAAPMFGTGSEIFITGDRVSMPYIDLTAFMMAEVGVYIEETPDGYFVENNGYSPRDYRIPPDYSSAAFPMVAAALGGKVTVKGMDPQDPQGDIAIIDILRSAGAYVTVRDDRITVERNILRGCDIDMSGTPDLFPVTAVLLSTAEGDSRLRGAPHLRFKESDRIASTVAMVNALGGSAEETDDGCIVHGVGRLAGGKVDACGDHRIAMSAAVASLVCDGDVEVDGMQCCSASYPGFVKDMKSVGLEAE